MADVSSFENWSTTASNNNPGGATVIGTSLDDNLREIQAQVREALAHKGPDIASASTVDLSDSGGLFHDITGITTITSFGTVSAGIWKVLKFEGALTLTHNATSLIIPGGQNQTTSVGDMCQVTSEGSGNWRMNWYLKNSGSPGFPYVDTDAVVRGSADGTKKLRFEVDGFTTATTRVLTAPDYDGTIATLAGTEALTSKTLTAPVLNGALTGDAIAAQAEMETATATDSIVCPGRLQFHPSAVKFHVAADASGNIAASYNMTSINDDATGVMTGTIATDFSGATTWTALGSIADSSATALSSKITAKAATTVTISVYNSATGAAVDPNIHYNIAGMGDQ